MDVWVRDGLAFYKEVLHISPQKKGTTLGQESNGYYKALFVFCIVDKTNSVLQENF